MTNEEKEKLDAYFKEYTADALAFLKLSGLCVNEYGAYIYQSTNGNCSINLELFLTSYKEYLIENNILKERL